MKRIIARFPPLPMLAAILLSLAPAGRAQEPAALEESVRHHWMGTQVETTESGATIQVEHLRHEFWFDAAIASHATVP